MSGMAEGPHNEHIHLPEMIHWGALAPQVQEEIKESLEKSLERRGEEREPWVRPDRS